MGAGLLVGSTAWVDEDSDIADAVPDAALNIDALPLVAEARGTRFATRTCSAGATLGLRRLGATLHVVPPGKTASPFHRHHTADEMFFILSGTGSHRLGEALLAVKAGDFLGAPAGGAAHQIINTGGEDLRYLALSNNGNADVVEYPDSERVRIDVGADGTRWEDGTFKAGGRLVPMGYWEGEDVGGEEG